MEAIEESSLSLSRSELLQLLLTTPYLTIKDLCANPQGSIADVCQDDEFWRVKFEQDFPYNRPNPRMTYRQQYEGISDLIIGTLTDPTSINFQRGLDEVLVKNEIPFDFVYGGSVTGGGGVSSPLYLLVPDVLIGGRNGTRYIHARNVYPSKPVTGDYIFVERNRGDPRTLTALIDADQFTYISSAHARMLLDKYLSEGYLIASIGGLPQASFNWLQKQGIANLVK